MFCAMPSFAVALDCQSCLAAFNHKVYPFSGNVVLSKNFESPPQQFQGNINLKPTLEWRRRIHNGPIVLGSSPLQFVSVNSGNLLRSCIFEEIEQLSPKASGANNSPNVMLCRYLVSVLILPLLDVVITQPSDPTQLLATGVAPGALKSMEKSIILQL